MPKYYDVWSAVMAKAKNEEEADKIYMKSKVKVKGKWLPLEKYNRSEGAPIQAYKLGKVI